LLKSCNTLHEGNTCSKCSDAIVQILNRLALTENFVFEICLIQISVFAQAFHSFTEPHQVCTGLIPLTQKGPLSPSRLTSPFTPHR